VTDSGSGFRDRGDTSLRSSNFSYSTTRFCNNLFWVVILYIAGISIVSNCSKYNGRPHYHSCQHRYRKKRNCETTREDREKSREQRYKDINEDKTRKYRSIEWKRVVDNGGGWIREKRNCRVYTLSVL